MGYYTFPHTRTYDSDLGWLICQTKKLLEMYDKWDQLPDMIKEILGEYINSGEINDIIEEIIGDFILNPKYPPSPDIPKASGDGSTDDTASIQGCIDYAAEHGKLGVYFPTGAYLTGSLALKDGISLFGSDRYTTKLVLKSGATSPLLSGNVTNMGIYRLTLDSNAGNQVNNITTVSITAGTNIEFNDLIFASGYVNLSYLGTSGHLQLSNIIFANAVLKHLLIAGATDVQAENLMFENLSAVSGNCCMDVSSDSGYYKFTSNATAPVCIRCAGTGNRFAGFIHNAVENVVDTGSDNDYIIYGQSQTETLSGDRKINAANLMENVAGDKTVNANDYDITAETHIHITTPELLHNGSPLMTSNKYIVSIKEYGAVGDGTTDDTESIKKALSSNYETILFPAGRYKCGSISVSKNLIMENSDFVCSVTGNNSFITVPTGKSVSLKINIDFSGTNPHYGVDIQGDGCSISGTFRNMTYNGTQDPNSCIHITGDNVHVGNVYAENFTQTSAGNDSCPQVIAVVCDNGCETTIDRVTSKNCRSTVVNAGTGNIVNIGDIIARDAHDNGLYTVRGGRSYVSTIQYYGTNEALAVITDANVETDDKSSAEVGSIITGNCQYVLRCSNIDFVKIGNVLCGGEVNKIIFLTSDSETINSIAIDNVTVTGTLHQFAFFGNRGVISSLMIGKIAIRAAYSSAFDETPDEYFNLEGVKELYIGSIYLTLLDTNNNFSNGARFRFKINDDLRASFIGPIIFNAYNSTGNADVLYAINNAGQDGLVITGGNVRSDSGDIDTNAAYGLPLYKTASNPPAAGTWKTGDLIFASTANTGKAGWVCINGGTPGIWAEISINQ